MTLPRNTDSDGYRFYKTLNEDVMIQPVSSTSQHWDIQMENGDYVNVDGIESLRNAICIAIMTRFNELDFIELYDGFGCRVHELVKANKSEMVKYKVELFVNEVLENMRRISLVNWIDVTDDDSCSYKIEFNVTSISDEIVTGSVTL